MLSPQPSEYLTDIQDMAWKPNIKQPDTINSFECWQVQYSDSHYITCFYCQKVVYFTFLGHLSFNLMHLRQIQILHLRAPFKRLFINYVTQPNYEKLSVKW